MKRFVADCMLGRLAKWMRYLGYDVLYFREIEDRELVRIARSEGRVLLTRDSGIPDRFCIEHYLVKSEDIDSQLKEIIANFPPTEKLQSRCLECNIPVQEVQDREEIKHRVPDYVLSHHKHLWYCPGCGRVFWSGTHYKNMEEKITKICN